MSIDKNIKIHSCNSVDEFLNYLCCSLTDRLVNKNEGNPHSKVGMGGLIFRGQNKLSWPLKPSVFRKEEFSRCNQHNEHKSLCESDDDFLSRNNKLFNENISRFNQLELNLVDRFVRDADRTGITIPTEYDEFEKCAKNLKDDRSLLHLKYCLFPSKNLYRSFAIAQHQGIATRLLDWSESPLVAAFFAAFDLASSKPFECNENEQIAVYILNANDIEKFGKGSHYSNISLVISPRSENLYLEKQRGIFLNFQHANEHYFRFGKWPCLEDYLPGDKSVLECVTLPVTHTLELIKRLHYLGVSKHNLMPTFENVANLPQYLEKIFNVRADVESNSE